MKTVREVVAALQKLDQDADILLIANQAGKMRPITQIGPIASILPSSGEGSLRGNTVVLSAMWAE